MRKHELNGNLQHQQDQTMERAQQPRRTFLKRLAAALGGLVIRRVSGPVLESSAVLSGTAILGEAFTHTTAEYPIPRYVPEGYRLVTQYTDRLDGFGGGKSEITLWYMNPTNPLAAVRPLSIYLSPTPKRRALSATEQHGGTPVMLRMPSGRAIVAEYHDGWWIPQSRSPQPAWNNTDAHSLTFTLGTLTVGVRGFRLAGVSQEDLIRVASSLA